MVSEQIAICEVKTNLSIFSNLPANHPVRKILEGHSREVKSVAVDVIVSGTSEKAVKVWSKRTGESLQILEGWGLSRA